MNLVRTSKRTPHFTITKINWLMLFNPLKTKEREKKEKVGWLVRDTAFNRGEGGES
jgi:hypothetical protein